MEPTEPATEQSRQQLFRHYREQLSRYKSANAELADVAWTLAELEQQISTLEADLAQNYDDYLAQRIKDLRRWRDSLEESVLQHMFLADELSDQVAQLRTALTNLPPDR